MSAQLQTKNADRRAIVQLRHQGITFAEIGRRLGISRQRVFQQYKKALAIDYRMRENRRA